MYSYDTITGEVSQQEVTATFALESDHLNYLTIVDEDGDEQIIETTDSHPFWVVTDEPDLERAARTVVDENGIILYHENLDSNLNGFWVEAKDLQEGDVFLGANGELSTLVATERVEFPDGIKVYNFTVAGNHDYYVIAETDEFGQTSILVHNGNCIRNIRLAGKNHPVTGVPFNKNGFPVFDEWAYIKVELPKFTSRNADNLKADKMTNGVITEQLRNRLNLTGHHHEDGKTMILVPRDIHRNTGHTGGVGL